MTFLLALIGVLGVSASGPIMAATPAPPLAIAFWRNLFSAGIMGAGELVRRQPVWRISRSELQTVLISGVALGLHFACFITALRLTAVATAAALVCLQSAFIAAINLVRRVPTGASTLLGLLVALLGVFTITGFDFSANPKALLGDALALAGAFLAAVYTMAGGRARRTMSTGRYTTWVYSICALTVVVLALITRQPLLDFPPEGWIGIIAVTLASSILGHTVFNHLLAIMSPLVVSMLILLEIPGTAILAAIFLQEVLAPPVYLGLALILVGLAVVISGQRAPKLNWRDRFNWRRWRRPR
ncbi:DMT family transporter [Haematomicrobium sanguinis]|uniref:DMT family transporter n=1 Tax=Haematomicrobium sanguinis TaxID=479106 RepID=UPI000478D744|nr:DMT family transporter [Haematomicrobium sanguinis]